MTPFPLHFHWLVNDLHVCAGPPSNGQPWCLDVDVWRPETGEGEFMLWDANSPWGLVRRDPRSRTIMSVSPVGRERDLLIVAEQGIGDIIQQLRYVPPVAAQFSRVRIQCNPELHRLIRLQAPGMVMEPVTPDQALADPPKARVSLMRMGALCSDPSRGAAYLTAARRPGAHLAERPQAGLRVGLNWSANRRGLAWDIKSIPLGLLERLVADHPDVRWVSVQWGDDETALDAAPWASGIERCGRSVRDVADLAEIIAGLDLLITIDSAPAHVAGALGVPVWTLLSNPCSWRWGLDSEETALYRSMRLIRQTVSGDWPECLARMSEQLRQAGHSTDPFRAKDGAPAPEPGPVAPGARNGPAPVSLSDALDQCERHPSLRAAFVARPLEFLEAQGVRLWPRDYRGLNQVFKAMVDFHGGFSWCSPLKSLQSATFNTTVTS
ncbi:glycosyltransferase family 9 protein [Parapusillimonas granuli]|uniref:Glycosyl transferase family 9 (Putative heptosyltransferase) n=1 Tax=Parapusillimonas granuli TaxID=380911 RepID=A0A853G301_9BURK|nr:glycosyltransferase family 9 protein [Parapusillimonas granuli]MBB5214716.1 hypothetical protein [Parapusillimonas granuli]MEB2398036.1 hypothetical protein [Alcaligenaceae bacterium]NYT48876.1 hypothetical protein [Parapusillimonas granuli]